MNTSWRGVTPLTRATRVSATPVRKAVETCLQPSSVEDVTRLALRGGAAI